MELSVMTFSVMMERLTGRMNARLLCEIARSADMKTLDLMDVELKLYGKEKLKKALSEAGLSCECLIASAPFFSDAAKVQASIIKALDEAKDMGATMLMLIPGQPVQAERTVCAGLSKAKKQEILAKKKNCTVAQIAMSYIFSQTMPVFAIVSATDPRLMGLNIQSTRIQLTTEEISWLENIDTALGG